MSDKTEIVNLSLQSFGSRTTVTAAELLNNSSNEAIQANLLYATTRDELLRMAPWDCAFFYANLNYITSAPGTPENTSAATTLWQRGQPAPPWAYEYQYPVDCLKACWIIPATQTGFASTIPITTAVTGGAAQFWNGPPQKFKVSTDLFFPVTGAEIVNGGSQFNDGDIITLEQSPQGTAPKGAPVQILVTNTDAGNITAIEVVNQIANSATPKGGSYFSVQPNPVLQGTVVRADGITSSSGTGASFNLTFGVQGAQRVILTNQEFATLAFVRQVTDPNVMDSLFLRAWTNYLGARLCLPLTGDKALARMLANERILGANEAIIEARKADANEGLTINDVTPDFVRVRGIIGNDWGGFGPGFDWGPTFSVFG